MGQIFLTIPLLLSRQIHYYYSFRSILGGFIDNHDHERFLNKNPSYTALRNNLAYIFMSQCIPILYYGTEQGFNGGNDPNCRESMWPYMNTSHVLYKFIQTLIQVRKSLGQSWLHSEQIERFVDPQVYAFSRQDTLVVITTALSNITRMFQSHPFQAGDTVQNLLVTKQKFTVLKNGKLTVTLYQGEPLVLERVGRTSKSDVNFPLVLLYPICFLLPLTFQFI